MTDAELREKVVQGLELCLKGLSDLCPYKDSDAPGGCRDELMYDVMMLLKAQEASAVHVTAEINYRKIGNCPNCGKPINSGDYPNYCGRCGQAVKWDGDD